MSEPVCESCGVVFPLSRKGAWPERCPDCRAARKVETTARWQKRNPEKVRASGRKYYLTKWYGIDISNVREAQSNRCLICGDEFSETNSPCVDHDHRCCEGPRACGKCVRGLLCGNCNLGLGHFRDTPALLRAAADYLEAWNVRGNQMISIVRAEDVTPEPEELNEKW